MGIIGDSRRMDVATISDTVNTASYKKNFEKALEAFQKVYELNPKDTVAQLFLQKTKNHISIVVPDDWTGVENMERK